MNVLTATVLFKLLELTVSGQSSLENVWWLDLKVTRNVSGHFASIPVTVSPQNILASNKKSNPSWTKLFDKTAGEVLSSDDAINPRNRTIIRLLFSKNPGHAVRSDYLVYRLAGAQYVASVKSFLDPRTNVAEVAPELYRSITTLSDFTKLFEHAIGGIVSSSPDELFTVESWQQYLDGELIKRLSVPWIFRQPLKSYRVFWVQGRADIGSSIQFYEAARALGITIVVLDQPGHWLQDDTGPHAQYREAFIPISVDGDEGLTQRVVEAVRSYPHRVDGIVTISDVRLPFVARACEILGLPTSPSAAYILAGDKGATRELEDAAADKKEGFVLNAADELDTFLEQAGNMIKYPLIVKPCSGWNSDCVVKVQNQDELFAAVLRASSRHANSPNCSTRVVVEPYIEGPEVDANFVILDGEVLFCDISDDFPSTGDHSGNSTSIPAANFMETLMDIPTNLPSEEQELMKSSLKESIVRLGFKSGVFHCEARVRNSRAQYKHGLDGILDMSVSTRTEPISPPSCYLHEVNARSPGYINCVAALLAYGVDYYAIRLLLSLGPQENERVKILAQPFLGSKPQYILGVVVLPPTRSGIMASENAVEDYLVENPDIRKHVVHHQTVRKKGEFVEGPDSDELLAVGYIIVASKTSRRQCLELARQISETFDYKLESD
ncbi:hypothetical protein COCC4DRAFT_153122 [Bipolaris maydis ATCC 48331]|uniref:ATP-grasp domain-containing protein n=2 Tax=Cochliobolus heterostrophus TaxID=5016 RepID=M2TTY6_COCH5|nr:uncharacterized protein COCC4DRAFT_153122 [Bipolaris maydis ATCC 48331]EMD85231.1 hypothetical protein COCHEDRAFT_1161520 [Bipolaris maydis C5]KAJ5041385.1 hypothetical protein J3E74DRAFT_231120 [Bipolaris maydis]ENH99474.1 hypothetical protein COCC4DRAFT_153122 [Bipolaris maydis ATCC 48331]KAJ5043192.1 hypothetical protein J3E74DRAFT_230540 [Bipolaris maydis]KAJ5058024.1 hypothetical protein J3E74DRAFT_220414 [Bipolaris maydis]